MEIIKMKHLRLFEEFNGTKKPLTWEDVDATVILDKRKDLTHYEAWEIWAVKMEDEDKIRLDDYFENPPKEDEFVVRVGGKDGSDYLIDTKGYKYARYVKKVVSSGDVNEGTLNSMKFMYSLDGKTIEGPDDFRYIYNMIKSKGQLITGTFTLPDVASGEPHKLTVHIKRKPTWYVYIGIKLTTEDLDPEAYDQWGNKKDEK